VKIPLSILKQYFLPQRLLSRFIGKVAHSKLALIKTPFIHYFHKHYHVNMQEALEPSLSAYPSFCDFFIRKLKPEARPVDAHLHHLVSPADGVISELGNIESTKLIQAKGVYFDLNNLFGQQSSIATAFTNGKFITIYLAPKDYHRVHMPLAGHLREMIYVPGKLFSVNTTSTQHIPQLFARNERVISIFETEAGPMALVLVGAMIVASINTRWAGQITPGAKRQISTHSYKNVFLQKGEEMGYFNLGSTVIVLFGDQSIAWESTLHVSSKLKMGEKIGIKGPSILLAH